MKKYFGWVALLLIALNVSCERVKEEMGAEANNPPPSPTEEKKSIEVTNPTEAPKAISVANVVLSPKKGDPITFTVEVARRPEERAQGLKGRDNLPEKHGMWFVFENDVKDPFWMKDTSVALDLLFIDKDYKVVDFIEKTKPLSEELLAPRKEYRYALELRAGSVEKWGIGLGDVVEFRVGPP